MALIRKAFNHRVLYFRQLQEISDSVVDVEWEDSVTAALELCQAEKVELDTKINTTRARHRYLVNLAGDNGDESDDGDSDQSCILCRCDFTRGFITHWCVISSTYSSKSTNLYRQCPRLLRGNFALFLDNDLSLADSAPVMHEVMVVEGQRQILPSVQVCGAAQYDFGTILGS